MFVSIFNTYHSAPILCCTATHLGIFWCCSGHCWSCIWESPTLQTGLIRISPICWTIHGSFQIILEWELSIRMELKSNALYKSIDSKTLNLTWIIFEKILNPEGSSCSNGWARVNICALGSSILPRVAGQFIVRLTLLSNGNGPLLFE